MRGVEPGKHAAHDARRNARLDEAAAVAHRLHQFAQRHAADVFEDEVELFGFHDVEHGDDVRVRVRARSLASSFSIAAASESSRAGDGIFLMTTVRGKRGVAADAPEVQRRGGTRRELVEDEVATYPPERCRGHPSSAYHPVLGTVTRCSSSCSGRTFSLIWSWSSS